MAFLCVGGDREGLTLENDSVQYTFYPDGIFQSTEVYIKIVPAKGETPFYMVAGMTPAAAVKRWRELTGKTVPA